MFKILYAVFLTMSLLFYDMLFVNELIQFRTALVLFILQRFFKQLRFAFFIQNTYEVFFYAF